MSEFAGRSLIFAACFPVERMRCGGRNQEMNYDKNDSGGLG